MRMSLGRFLVGIACVAVLLSLIGKYVHTWHWSPAQVGSVLNGTSAQQIAFFSIECAGEHFVISGERECSYLTNQFGKSVSSGSVQTIDLGRRSVFCGTVNVTLANGASVEGPAFLGESGILLSVPPHNKLGWDFVFTHHIPWDDAIPPNLDMTINDILSKHSRHPR